jgi:hypothetical protein
MTESEAIKILKKDSCYECAQGTNSPLDCEYGECRVAKATRVAIKALEDVQQYRAIGTPEELKAVMKYVYLAKKHGTVGQVIENCVKYEEIGTPEECRAAMEKQNVNKELESHDEKHILECCISLMQEVVNEFAEWYRWQHGEDAIEELDEEERFCFRKSYFRIVQELFLLGTNHSGGTSTRAKCEQLGVDSADEIEFDWSDEE